MRQLLGKRELEITNDVPQPNDVSLTNDIVEKLVEKPDDQLRSLGLDPARLPQNTAASGQWALIECAASPGSSSGGSGNHRVQWREFVYTTDPYTGSLISENEFMFDHPHKSRYSIVHGDPNEYSLRIGPLAIADGGYYVCEDVNANPLNKKKHGLQLTVVGKYFFL